MYSYSDISFSADLNKNENMLSNQKVIPSGDQIYKTNAILKHTRLFFKYDKIWSLETFTL